MITVGTRVEVIEPECPAFGKHGTVMAVLPGIGVKVLIDKPYHKDLNLTEEQKLRVASWGSLEYVKPLAK